MGNAASIDQSEDNTITEQGPLLATYKLLPDYQWTESHQCYTNSAYNLQNIPVPAPPINRKSDIFDQALYESVDIKALQTPGTYLKKPLPALARYLTRDYNDSVSKVRAIFRWITAQPLEQLNIPDVEPNHVTPLYQLWRIKNQKGNYAQLFSLLCSFAHIPCIIINGKLKGSTYEVGDSFEDDKHNGEWNAVLINGDWRFVNPFWGACAEGSDGEDSKNKSLVYCCDENYFLTDPDQFIRTHFPDEDSCKWQLLPQIATIQNFKESALLKDRFFNMNLTLNYPDRCVLFPKNEATISFGLKRDDQSNLRFLALLTADKDPKELQRYVFIETINQEETMVRVRPPGGGEYKLEIVGKDENPQGPSNNFDWVAIYKIAFKNKAEVPFPECPSIGWGPGSHLMWECGVAPVSHLRGEIKTDTGSFEVKFKKENGFAVKYWSELFQNADDIVPISNHVVQRVEDNMISFNVDTPTSGEFALKIYATDSDEIVTNICNYLILSGQSKDNIPFPRDLQDFIGEKGRFHDFGIKCLSPPSPYIETEKEITFEFEKPQNIELSALVVCDEMMNQESFPWKLKPKTKETAASYKLKLKKTGNYEFRVKAVKSGEDATPETVYDALLKFTKVKKQKKAKQQENVSPPEEIVETKDSTIDELPDEIKDRMKAAVSRDNDVELLRIVDEINLLNLSTKEEEIRNVKFEISIIKCRRELYEAFNTKTINSMEMSLKHTNERGCEKRLKKEVGMVKSMLERIKQINKIFKDVLSLEQRAITEIRRYNNPPPVVHKVMVATLLLIGYSEEETEEWNNIQKILGGTVRESVLRKISKFDIDKIELNLAVGARAYLTGITMDDVRLISGGAVAFYHWVKGVTEEIVNRKSDEI